MLPRKGKGNGAVSRPVEKPNIPLLVQKRWERAAPLSRANHLRLLSGAETAWKAGGLPGRVRGCILALPGGLAGAAAG